MSYALGQHREHGVLQQRRIVLSTNKLLAQVQRELNVGITKNFESTIVINITIRKRISYFYAITFQICTNANEFAL